MLVIGVSVFLEWVTSSWNNLLERAKILGNWLRLIFNRDLKQWRSNSKPVDMIWTILYQPKDLSLTLKTEVSGSSKISQIYPLIQTSKKHIIIINKTPLCIVSLRPCMI